MLSQEEQWKLVEDNYVKAQQLVGMAVRNVPARIEKDDLYAQGYLGLVKAARKFDPARGNKFMTFAELFIVGHIKDYLRTLGQNRKKHRLSFVSLDSALPGSLGEKDIAPILSSLEICQQKETQVKVRRAIRELDQPYRAILWMYYIWEMPQSRIAELLGVSPSYVSLRKTEGVRRLKNALTAKGAPSGRH